MLQSVLAKHWIRGRILAVEELIAQRKKARVAAAMTTLCMGCSEEDSVCINGRVIGRRHFSFIEEGMSELASDWKNRMGWHSGQGGTAATKARTDLPRAQLERNRS